MKRIRVLLIALILILVSVFFGSVYAVNIQAQKTRPFSDDDGEGTGGIGDSEYRFLRGTGGLNRGYTVFKLFESGDSNYANTYYCLRGRKGFGAKSWTDPNTGVTEYTDVSTSAVSYTSLGEMHENSTNVINKFNELYGVNLNETKTVVKQNIYHENVTYTFNLYNAILWVLDNSYIPVNKLNGENEIVYNETNYKKELLKKAGIVRTQMDEITKDDIEVIQQLAIWYFTNYDQQDDAISVSRKEPNVADYLGIVLNGDNSTYDNNMFTGTRLENLNKLYKYLINGAIAANSEYGTGTTRKIETDGTRTFDKTIKLRIEPVNITVPGQNPAIYYPENHYHKIGPFKIGSNSEKTILSSDITLIDGAGTIVPRYYTINATSSSEIYHFIDAEGNRVDTLNENTQYYIRIDDTFVKGTDGNTRAGISESSSFNMGNVTLELASTYRTNTAEFFVSNQNASGNQVLAKINKEIKTEGDRISTKSFDLSLRKYISSIMRNNQPVSFTSREPVINTVNLENGISTTAIYKHPKNTLTVKTGDTVIYKIRIYNEGEVDGTATEVTDYLPEGLELAENSTTNTRYRWTSEDGKTIKTDYLKVNNIQIPAFDKTKTDFTTSNNNIRWQRSIEGIGGVYHGLYYAELEVECVVSEKPGEVDKILKNVAEITAAEDIDGNEIINPGDDRDSEPGNVYEDDRHTPGTEVDGYTPGEQDDDDFEPLKLEKGLFDLSLRKFITSLNGTELEGENSREPRLDVSKLNNPDTTAIYKHPKNKLTVETNDTVIYTIRVYNEGDLDGKATLVTDYLPDGLQMVAGSTINEKWTMYDSEGNVTENVEDAVKVTTDALKDTVIMAYNPLKTEKVGEEKWQKATEGGNSGLYYADLTVECKVVATMGSEDKTLKNVAEITEDTGDDRDSTPGNVFEDDEHTPGDEEDEYTPGEEDDDDFEDLVLPTKKFDLALRKYITKVEKVVDGEADRQNVEIPESSVRNLNNINKNTLNTTDEDTTAEYKHKKNPIVVEPGNIVTYTIRIYNEGELAGRATKIVDQLPTGLKFLSVVSGNYELDEYDEEANKVSLKEKTGENENLAAYNKDTKVLDYTSIELECEVTETVGGNDKVLTNIAYISEEYNAVKDLIITNQQGEDRDSEPQTAPNKTADELRTIDEIGYTGKDSHTENELSNEEYFEGQQDDDDFEKVIILGKRFDLSLRKYIAAINGVQLEGEDSRVPRIDTSKLNTIDETTGNKITTAIYKHSKEPLVVKKGDIVTYKIRIYNEGERDGYATKVTDYLPDGLGFLYTADGTINSGWLLSENIETKSLYGEDGIYSSEENVLKKNAYKEVFGEDVDLASIQVITAKSTEEETSKMLAVTAGGTVGNTEIKATDLIKAYGTEKQENDKWQQSTNNENDGLFYDELEITCVVLKENTFQGTLKNVAEITGAKDSEGNEIRNPGDDRDSEPENVYEDGTHTPGTQVDGYTPGEQDDDDFEPLVLRYFDLALRKFITNIESAGTETEVTSRIPRAKMGEDGNIKYEHTKEPLYVANNDIVTYTIRVFNEGTMAGYAEEITDDLPEGLLFLPDNKTNKKYGWVMIDKDGNVTENVEDAVKVTTDYLSSNKETESRINKLNPFDSSKEISAVEPLNPDYKDVQIAFQVTEPNTSDRILVNSAQISEDSDDDEDSIPDEWNDGEDDQDKEYIKVRYFDLSLLKWVTQSIVTVDGKTTTTNTGFKPNTGKTETTGIRGNNEAEPIAKVELDKKKLDKTTVKFVYKIRVTNEGELEGYATEITDYIPDGLEFNLDDNKAFGWEKKGDDKVTTRALETKLLKPGESAELTIVFRWKNNSKNLGLKTNIAAITEDYNEHNSKDIDSKPGDVIKPYEKEQEDDDDFALVMLSLKTGKIADYTLLVTSMIAVLGAGIYLVKKYVLD